MQELHDRQHLHQDVLLASLPAQLPARHHLHKVSSCKNNCLAMSLEETGFKMSSNFCRVITAEYGYFVRIDFRDMFRIEPASNDGKCAYDYLEVGRKKILEVGRI